MISNTSIRLFKIAFLTIILFLGNLNKALAWGHLKYLNDDGGNSALIHRVLENHAITYCIEIHDSRFNYDSIEIQLKMVLSIWLKPLEDMGISGVSISSARCSQNNFDLKIEIGPEIKFPQLGAYQLPVIRNHNYSHVKIDSNYIYTDTNSNQKFNYIDFIKIIPSSEKMQQFLQNISIVNLTTPYKLQNYLKLDYKTIYFTTYRVLLHELGHSFGLCDLYPTQININCDPLHMSPGPRDVQPKALMNDSNFFYLTEDDIEGIQSLASRFKK